MQTINTDWALIKRACFIPSNESPSLSYSSELFDISAGLIKGISFPKYSEWDVEGVVPVCVIPIDDNLHQHQLLGISNGISSVISLISEPIFS